MAGIGG